MSGHRFHLLAPATTEDGDPTVTSISAAPDLQLRKQAAVASVVPGGTIGYTLSFANVGTQDATGVMTFLIGTDGTVWQKDLGPDTDAAARRITLYNPDTSWQRVR